MWKRCRALLLVAMTATALVVPAIAQQPQIVGIASVVDGDAIEIHGQSIRLSGYDTPEEGARCGDTNVHQAASLALSDFIGKRTVSCTPTGTDNYNRTVATCGVGRAHSASRGLWALQCPANLWGDRDYSR
jgi:endonuclease YncB( thermonuclease family)